MPKLGIRRKLTDAELKDPNRPFCEANLGDKLCWTSATYLVRQDGDAFYLCTLHKEWT